MALQKKFEAKKSQTSNIKFEKQKPLNLGLEFHILTEEDLLKTEQTLLSHLSDLDLTLAEEEIFNSEYASQEMSIDPTKSFKDSSDEELKEIIDYLKGCVLLPTDTVRDKKRIGFLQDILKLIGATQYTRKILCNLQKLLTGTTGKFTRFLKKEEDGSYKEVYGPEEGYKEVTCFATANFGFLYTSAANRSLSLLIIRLLEATWGVTPYIAYADQGKQIPELPDRSYGILARYLNGEKQSDEDLKLIEDHLVKFSNIYKDFVQKGSSPLVLYDKENQYAVTKKLWVDAQNSFNHALRKCLARGKIKSLLPIIRLIPERLRRSQYKIHNPVFLRGLMTNEEIASLKLDPILNNLQKKYDSITNAIVNDTAFNFNQMVQNYNTETLKVFPKRVLRLIYYRAKIRTDMRNKDKSKKKINPPVPKLRDVLLELRRNDNMDGLPNAVVLSYLRNDFASYARRFFYLKDGVVVKRDCSTLETLQDLQEHFEKHIEVTDSDDITSEPVTVESR